ncbi:MAG: hypothetical protein LC667_01480 [Thioalkalivibrio sp.]|nr:hypothetical protein [Thioalkalivibrio sp.]
MTEAEPGRSRVVLVVLSALAFVLGIATVVLFNIVGSALVEGGLPGTLAEDGMPLTTGSRVLLKGVVFAAGVAGAAVVAVAAPIHPILHLWILLGIYLVVDTGAVVALWDSQPRWFTLLILPLAFPQLGLGGRLGLALRGKWRRTGSGGAGA